MKRHIITIKEAAQEWVREMNAIDQGMIAKLMSQEPEDWEEVTTPAVGDRVDTWSDKCDGEGEIIGYDDENELFVIEMDSDETVHLEESEFYVQRDGDLPMWGTMWSFGDSIDDEWLYRGGVEAMSRCGFRIYHSREYGYFFGIDGAGYDFYESHWIPLYKARGIHWHEEEENE